MRCYKSGSPSAFRQRYEEYSTPGSFNTRNSFFEVKPSPLSPSRITKLSQMNQITKNDILDSLHASASGDIFPLTNRSACAGTASAMKYHDALPATPSLLYLKGAVSRAPVNTYGMSSLLTAAAKDLARLDSKYQDDQENQRPSACSQIISLQPQIPRLFRPKPRQEFERLSSAKYPHRSINEYPPSTPETLATGCLQEASNARITNKYRDARELPFREKKREQKFGDVFSGAGALSEKHLAQPSETSIIFSESFLHGAFSKAPPAPQIQLRSEKSHEQTLAKQKQESAASEKARYAENLEKTSDKTVAASWRDDKLQPGSTSFSDWNDNWTAMEPNTFPTSFQCAVNFSARNVHQATMQPSESEIHNEIDYNYFGSEIGRKTPGSNTCNCNLYLDHGYPEQESQVGTSSSIVGGRYRDKATQTPQSKTSSQNSSHVCIRGCCNYVEHFPQSHVQVNFIPASNGIQNNRPEAQQDVWEQTNHQARSSGPILPANVTASHHLGCGNDIAVNLDNALTWNMGWFCSECGMTWDRNTGEVTNSLPERLQNVSVGWGDRTEGSSSYRRTNTTSWCANPEGTIVYEGITFHKVCQHSRSQAPSNIWAQSGSPRENSEGPALHDPHRFNKESSLERPNLSDTSVYSNSWGSTSTWGKHSSSSPTFNRQAPADQQGMHPNFSLEQDGTDADTSGKPQFHDPYLCYCGEGDDWNCWTYSCSRLSGDGNKSEGGDGVLTPTESEFGDEYPS